MAGRKPGGPKTGGRKKGVTNKVTKAERDKIAASGLTPLAYMLSVMRDEENPATFGSMRPTRRRPTCTRALRQWSTAAIPTVPSASR